MWLAAFLLTDDLAVGESQDIRMPSPVFVQVVKDLPLLGFDGGRHEQPFRVVEPVGDELTLFAQAESDGYHTLSGPRRTFQERRDLRPRHADEIRLPVAETGAADEKRKKQQTGKYLRHFNDSVFRHDLNTNMTSLPEKTKTAE